MQIIRLLATAIVAVTLFLPAVGNQQQAPAKKKDGGNQNQSSPNPVTAVISQPCTQTQKDSPCEQPRKGPPIYSNWALVFVAGVAAIAGFLNLGQIKKQSKATEDAAKAASENAEAVMRGERAWLLIDILEPDDYFTIDPVPRFKYRVTNYGKTPGFMLSANAYIQLEERNDWITNDAFLNMGVIAEDAALAPKGDPLELFGNITAGDRQFRFSGGDHAKVFNKPPQAYIFVVGSIHYHDVFGKTTRRTPFAYWYDVNSERFVRLRTPGYNKPV